MLTFPTLDRPTVFIAAPGDLEALRRNTRSILAEITKGAADDHGIDVYDWDIDVDDFDHSTHAQLQIPPPGDPHCRAVVCMFGEKIGTPLFQVTPLDELRDHLGIHATQPADRKHRLVHPWPEDPEKAGQIAESGGFPLTGTVFECLAALHASEQRKGSTPVSDLSVRIVLVGDAEIHEDGDVEDAGWGCFRLYKAQQADLKPSQFRAWRETVHRPQLLQLRNFVRYLGPVSGIFPVPKDHDGAQDEIRDFLRNALRLPEHADDRDPFKGLEAFDVEDATVFYGRQTERRQSVRHLEDLWTSGAPRFFGIVAGSGVGKSSFLRAGLFGHLTNPLSYRGGHDYEGFCVRPDDLLPAGSAGTGEDAAGPLHHLFSLALHCLVRERTVSESLDIETELADFADLKDDLQAGALVARLHTLLGNRRFLIGLDQFEEIVDQRSVPELRPLWQPLVDFIACAARSERIAILYTLQNNRTEALSLDPVLGPLAAYGGERKLSFPEQGLSEIITEPFRRARTPLEPALTRALEGRILAFLEGDPAAGESDERSRRLDTESRASLLPLVSLALRRIYTEVGQPALEFARLQRLAHADGAFESTGERSSTVDDAGAASADFSDAVAAAGAETGPDGRSDAEVVLRLKDCAHLLDIGTAIAELADNALEAARDASGPEWSDEDTLSGLFDRLVRPDSLYGNRFSLPAVPMPEAGARRRLADELVERRLLIPHSLHVDHVQLVHESVLYHWPPAAEWRESHRDIMELEEEVRLYAQQWDAYGRSEDRLVAFEVDKAAELLARQVDTFTARDAHGEVALLRAFGLALLAAHPTPARIIANTKQDTRHMMVAMAYGDVALVRRYIEVDEDAPRLTRLDDRTPVFWPSFTGEEALLDLLLDAGADASHADRDGWQPIHAAASSGQIGALRRLVKAGASVAAPGQDGQTSLHLAAMNGHAGMIDELLSLHGADPDVKNDGGWTPLALATRNGHHAAVLQLLEGGAGASVALANGLSPLHLAAQERHVAIVVDLLRHGAEFDARTTDQRSALHVAAENGHADVVSTMLGHTASGIDGRDKDERTALHLAAEKGHASVVEALLDAGADADARTNDKRTALHLAAEKGQLAVLRALEGRSDLTALDESGRWPLRSALVAGQYDAARTLVDELGAPTDAPRRNGWALLHLATLRGDPQEVAFLLDALGADPNIAGPDGSTPLHLAAEIGRAGIARLLGSHSGIAIESVEVDGMTPLHVAAGRGHADVIACLIDGGAAPGALDGAGWSALHHAAWAGHMLAVQRLLDAGADIEGRDSNGGLRATLTPLQAAAEVGNRLVLGALLDRANIDAASSEKPAALTLAIRNRRYRSALQLLDAGASLPAVDSAEREALEHVFIANWTRRLDAGAACRPAEAELAQRLLDSGFALPFEPPAPGDEVRSGPDGTFPVDGRVDQVLGYAWAPPDPALHTWLLGQLLSIDEALHVDGERAEITVAPLAWYDNVQLLRITDEDWPVPGLAIYFLLLNDTLYRLNGKSPPIHEVNLIAPIRLDATNVLAYLRFFCFFVRGDEGPFHIAESIDDPILPKGLDGPVQAAIRNTVRPAILEGRDMKGCFLCNATVFYSNAMFAATFEVQTNGMIQMQDDEPIASDLPVHIHAPIVYQRPGSTEADR